MSRWSAPHWTLLGVLLALAAVGLWKGLGQGVAALLPFAGVVAIAIARPRAGLYLLLLGAPFRGALLLTGDAWSASKIVGIALAVGMVARWVRRRRLPRVHPGAWALAGIVALGALSIVDRAGPISWWNLGVWGQFLLVAVFVADLLDGEGETVGLLTVLSLSAAGSAVFLLADYLPSVLAAGGTESPWKYCWWLFPDGTRLSTLFACGLLAWVGIEPRIRSRALRIGLWAAQAPTGLALLVLGSRLAAGALLVGLLVWVFAGGGVRRRAVPAIGLMALLAALGLAATGAGIWDRAQGARMVATFESLEGATSSRNVIWRVGIAIVAEHPVRGVGVGNFPREFERIRIAENLEQESNPVREPHNDFLGLAAEVGLLGPVLLLVALGWLSWRLIRLDPDTRAGPASLLACAAAMMLGLDMLEVDHTWVVLGVAMGVTVGSSTRSRRSRSSRRS